MAVTQSETFPAVPDSLEPIRNFVESAATAHGLDKSKTYKLCLAIDEISANIINYGYPLAGIDNGSIEVISQPEPGRITIVLIDAALPFDPYKKELPTQEDLDRPVEEKPIGGLGIFIALQSVDELKYEYKDGKNHNIFIVNL